MSTLEQSHKRAARRIQCRAARDCQVADWSFLSSVAGPVIGDRSSHFPRGRGTDQTIMSQEGGWVRKRRERDHAGPNRHGCRSDGVGCMLVQSIMTQPRILIALSYYYYNGYAAGAALAGASFEILANMTRPDPCAV